MAKHILQSIVEIANGFLALGRSAEDSILTASHMEGYEAHMVDGTFATIGKAMVMFNGSRWEA